MDRALAGGVGRGRRDVVDREHVGRDAARPTRSAQCDRPLAGRAASGERPDDRSIDRDTSAVTSAPHGWNLAEIWEHNADRFPDAVAQIQGDAHVHVARVRPARRRHRRDAARRRRAAPGQGGALPVQLPRVPREHVRHVQGRRSCRSTPTTATPTTSSRTCGTTPTPSRSIFHGTFTERCAAHARPGARGAHVDLGRRRHRAVPRLGDRLRDRRGVGDRRARSRRGAAAPTTCTSSTPAAPPACRRA